MPNDYIFITFKTYRDKFLEALRAVNPTEFHALFYRKAKKGIEVFFSWNAFKIKTFISYKDLEEIYKDSKFNVANIVLSTEEGTPEFKMFYHDYLLDRGIEIAME